MYIPKERLRHPLPSTRPPSEPEARASRLFSPLTLPNGVKLHSRSWVPAMVPWRATEDGLVTEQVLAWYERFARGKPGAIVIEATGIREIASGPLLRIGDDRFISGLRELTQTVARASEGETKLFIQLIDFLRIRKRPERTRYLSSFLRLRAEHRERLSQLLEQPELMTTPETSLRELLLTLSDEQLALVLSARERTALNFGERELVSDEDLPHIAELPNVLPGLFARAAERAVNAGFHGVELHYAHAYTMASFLSAKNQRKDGYGSTLDGRMRLPLEVFRAVRGAVPREFVVGARFLADEVIEHGHRADDATAFALAFAGVGMDFLSLSTGGKFDDAKQPKVGEAAYPYTGPSGFECMPPALSDARGPYGRQLVTQGAIRRAVRAAGFSTPVVVAGGIASFEIAEGALERGDADLVASARQSLADPDWWLKLRLGRGSEIRRCVYSNYCEGLDQKHRSVTCKLWDRSELDQTGAQLTDGGRRRLLAPDWR
jgi:2,4-dienoyl-CoA reductase-like NADH-dependent reductase (Old Yellow Enzyme family)